MIYDPSMCFKNVSAMKKIKIIKVFLMNVYLFIGKTLEIGLHTVIALLLMKELPICEISRENFILN